MLRIYIVVIVLTFHSNLTAQIVSPNQVKVDSVLNAYFTILDESIMIRDTLSVLAFDDKELLDHFELEVNIMEIFASLSEIEVDSVVHMYASGPVLEKSMIEKWQRWFADNRDLLVWDAQNSRLDRIDKTLYEK